MEILKLELYYFIYIAAYRKKKVWTGKLNNKNQVLPIASSNMITIEKNNNTKFWTYFSMSILYVLIFQSIHLDSPKGSKHQKSVLPECFNIHSSVKALITRWLIFYFHNHCQHDWNKVSCANRIHSKAHVS